MRIWTTWATNALIAGPVLIQKPLCRKSGLAPKTATEGLKDAPKPEESGREQMLDIHACWITSGAIHGIDPIVVNDVVTYGVLQLISPKALISQGQVVNQHTPFGLKLVQTRVKQNLESTKVEARKLEHHSPPALKVKYRGSQH